MITYWKMYADYPNYVLLWRSVTQRIAAATNSFNESKQFYC